MKKLLLFLIINFLFFSSLLWREAGGETSAQSPLVKQWDYRFGGIDDDRLFSIQQTKDSGFMLGGFSWSGIGGDKTQANWDMTNQTQDYWILKTDSLGNKQWDKDFGGTSYDGLFSIQQTADGGFILGGYSWSGIGGNKTQASWGGYDYWILKIDALGNKQWDKDFGGTNDDYLFSIQETNDNGFILGGYSWSGIGGDKTQAGWGASEYWIVKTDSLGNKQWDKDFGGTDYDELFSIQQTADGGFILGGFSESGISGDKTQATWGGYDYWIVKTDSLGNKQWDKDFGGTVDDYLHSIQLTSDGGFILGGYSFSGIGGDKTQAGWGGSDYWILKTDSLGNKQWDKDFGGTNAEDEFHSITQTSDGGYLMTGNSYSQISGDKTENNLGPEQTWILKTDSNGIKQWDKTLHTNASIDDEIGLAIQTRDGCYLMANWTSGGNGGDKSQASQGGSDYWIIKFCDSTLTTGLTPALAKGEEFAVFPNPFTSEISFTISRQNTSQASFIIKNILGQTVFTQQENNLSSAYTKTVDLSFLSKGIYFVDVTINGNRTVKKIIKQ